MESILSLSEVALIVFAFLQLLTPEAPNSNPAAFYKCFLIIIISHKCVSPFQGINRKLIIYSSCTCWVLAYLSERWNK